MGNADTTVQKAGVPKKSGENSDAGGEPRDVLLRDVPSDVRSDDRKGERDGEGLKAKGTNGPSAFGPADAFAPENFRLALGVDWYNLPIEHGEEMLRSLREAYDRGVIILRDRSRSLAPIHKCNICQTDVADGKWMGRFVVRDPDTQKNSIVIFCSDKCYQVYRFQISAGSMKPGAGVKT